MEIKVACLQYPVINADILANEEVYLKKINFLKGQNIDYIVLPEMCFSGFDYANLKEHSNKTESIIEKIANSLDKNKFVFSSMPENVDNRTLNTIFIISSGGVVGKYSKNMLFATVNEHIYFASSRQVKTFCIKGINIATFLCYELRFPELIRMATYSNDIQIIVIPAIWPHLKIDHWLTLLKSRAIENHCFIVGCNASYVTTKNKHIDCGTSAIIDPWGKIMSRIEKDNSLITEINLDLVEKTKELVPSLEQAKNYFNITFL
jgi:predicted amidohydrolase